MKLFLDEKLTFEKTAQKELKNSDMWAEDIMKELISSNPYLGAHSMRVVFKDRNDESGYGLAFVEVTGGDTSIKIPAVIKANKLFPMDVFVFDRKVFPLTKTRVETTLFSPNTLGKTIDENQVLPTSLTPALENYYPPDMRYGFGQVIKTSSLLQEIKPTMRESHLKKIASILGKDSTIHKLAINTPAVLHALKIFAESETMTKTASASIKLPDPTVIQIIATKDNTYMVKTASHLAFKSNVEILDRATALVKYGAESVRVADTRGSITAAVTPGDKYIGNPRSDEFEPIHRSGIYKVLGADGTIHMGMVIPNVFDLEGNKVEAMLFTNGDKYSLQPNFKGMSMGDIRYPAGNAPNGPGVFMWEFGDKNFDGEGYNSSYSTIPLTVDTVEEFDGKETMHVTDMTGASYDLVRAPVKTLIHTDTLTMVPDRAVFLPIGELLPLADNYQAEKISEAKTASKNVTIKFAGDRFSFMGPCLAKIAEDATTNLDWRSAQFLGCSLGMSPEFADAKLAQAMKYGTTTVKIARALTPYSEYERKVMEKVAVHRGLMDKYAENLSACLLKEAIDIGDEDTVDKVLSLNFITPENISKFIEYLPELEKAQEKMCELLVAVRLGLNQDINDGALSTAIKSMEKAIEGLRRLSYRTIAQ